MKCRAETGLASRRKLTAVRIVLTLVLTGFFIFCLLCLRLHGWNKSKNKQTGLKCQIIDAFAQRTKILLKQKDSNWLEKIFLSDVTYMKWIPKIYKQHFQLHTSGNKKPDLKNGTRIWIDIFLTKMVISQNERFSTSLTIRKMQIKTTMEYHFTPVRIIIVKGNE